MCQVIKFQFLYGSIKSDTDGATSEGGITFQFLYGSIKRAHHSAHSQDEEISIPVWFD